MTLCKKGRSQKKIKFWIFPYPSHFLFRYIQNYVVEWILNSGQKVRLKCPSHHPWMLCVWRSPEMSKLCILNIDNVYANVCNEGNVNSSTNLNGNKDSKYVVFVRSHSCDISFKAGYKMNNNIELNKTVFWRKMAKFYTS